MTEAPQSIIPHQEGSQEIKASYRDLALKVWQKAISQSQRPRLEEVGKDVVIPFVLRALDRMFALEEVAKTPLLDRITEEDIKMNAIWCPSAPGTWQRPWKKDRYEKLPFTKWWDRDQIRASIKISRAIGRLRIGQPAKGQLSEELQEEALGSSPPIIYNGRLDENAALREVIESGTYESEFLKEQLYLIDTERAKAFNSLDQVRNFKLPERNIESGDNIGIVIRPGQATRMLHFLANPKNEFPEDVRVKIFPVATGVEGTPHHQILETCGLLYYRFSSGDAAEKPYPYVV